MTPDELKRLAYLEEMVKILSSSIGSLTRTCESMEGSVKGLFELIKILGKSVNKKSVDTYRN